eukprot:COSAG03_NODE_8640_length_784_cov_1.226277_1_plen_205_part_10
MPKAEARPGVAWAADRSGGLREGLLSGAGGREAELVPMGDMRSVPLEDALNLSVQVGSDPEAALNQQPAGENVDAGQGDAENPEEEPASDAADLEEPTWQIHFKNPKKAFGIFFLGGVCLAGIMRELCERAPPPIPAGKVALAPRASSRILSSFRPACSSRKSARSKISRAATHATAASLPSRPTRLDRSSPCCSSRPSVPCSLP